MVHPQCRARPLNQDAHETGLRCMTVTVIESMVARRVLTEAVMEVVAAVVAEALVGSAKALVAAAAAAEALKVVLAAPLGTQTQERTVSQNTVQPRSDECRKGLCNALAVEVPRQML